MSSAEDHGHWFVREMRADTAGLVMKNEAGGSLGLLGGHHNGDGQDC
jgi:hypothetical protein